MADDDRSTPTPVTRIAPLGRMGAFWRRASADDSGPAHDWAEASDGRGDVHPADLPDGVAHLSVQRTFSFVDLCGFTAFTRSNGPHRAVQLLAEFRQITRDVAAKRGVRVAKWLGDGVMLVSVQPAPVIAMAGHLQVHFADTDLEVRVGIATGTALLFEGDDYIGEPVNLAAKLCAAAGPGEILADIHPGDVPSWVRHDSVVTVKIRGIGSVGGIRRLSAVPHPAMAESTAAAEG